MDCGLPEALSEMLRAAAKLPGFVEENVTAMAQELAAASEPPFSGQEPGPVEAIAKLPAFAPEIEALESVRGAEPVLETVIVSAGFARRVRPVGRRDWLAARRRRECRWSWCLRARRRFARCRCRATDKDHELAGEGAGSRGIKG